MKTWDLNGFEEILSNIWRSKTDFALIFSENKKRKQLLVYDTNINMVQNLNKCIIENKIKDQYLPWI